MENITELLFELITKFIEADQKLPFVESLVLYIPLDIVEDLFVLSIGDNVEYGSPVFP